MKDARMNSSQPTQNQSWTQPGVPLAVMAAAALPLLAVFGMRAEPGQDNRAPDLTGAAAVLQVPPGNKVHYHVYAAGVQIYTNDTARAAWVFKAPEAVLFDAEGNVVGIHYAGPTWESDS